MADSTDSSGIPILGPILDAITTIFDQATDIGSLAKSVGDVERAAWNNAISDATWAFGEIGKIWDIIKSIAESIALALYHLIIDYIIPIIKQIIAAIKWLKGKLDAILKPLQKILARIRNFYINHILKWELLAIQIISVVRLWLTLLRLLHVKWAAQLDADLQKIQGYITDTITPVVSTLNTISGVLGLMVNPLGFLSKSFMLGSLTNSLADVKKAAGYGSARLIYPDEKAQEKSQKDAVYGTAPLASTDSAGNTVYDPALASVDTQLGMQEQSLGIVH